MHRHALFLAFIVAIVVLLLHLVGMLYSLYWLWQPFDILVHAFAGLSVGLFFAWFSKEFLEGRGYWVSVFLGIFIVGILWEYFEHLVGLTFSGTQSYLADTIFDIITDLVGAYVGGLLARK